MAESRPKSARGYRSLTNENQPLPKSEVNVQVVVRCRPFNKAEVVSKTLPVVEVDESSRSVTVFPQMASQGRKFSKSFTFDRVFGPDSGQQAIFDHTVAPIVDEVLAGFNCTIFAYGQTGTGKTHTMEGVHGGTTVIGEQAGVIPRCIKQIFDTLERTGAEYSVRVSFLELYNEELFDLLGSSSLDDASIPSSNSSGPGMGQQGRGELRLVIRDNEQGVSVVQGAEECLVKGAGEIFSLLERGSQRRSKAETLLNKQSSRSHSLFIITIWQKESSPEGEEVIKVGKLNLVDLAGSENVSKSGAKDARAREAGNINQSLLTLGRVITALTEGQPFVPYRDSKLTRLLKESLGGRAKTCIIATVAPTAPCLEETLNTLDYAYRAKSIKNKPEVNCKVQSKVLIKELGAELQQLREMLTATRMGAGGVFVPNAHYEEMVARDAAREVAMASMESDMKRKDAALAEARSVLARRSRDLVALEARHAKLQVEASTTSSRLSRAAKALRQRTFLVERHVSSEEALEELAGELHDALTARVRDVRGLQAKLGRKQIVEEENAANMATLEMRATEHLVAMDAALQSALSSHAKAHQASLEQVAATMDAHGREVEGALGAVQALQRALGQSSDDAVRVAETIAGAAREELQALHHVATEEARAARSATERTIAAATSALGQLQAATVAQREALAAFFTLQVSQQEALSQHVGTLLGEMRVALGEVTREVSSLEAASAARVTSMSERLAATEAALQVQSAAAQQALLHQVTSLVQEAFAAQRAGQAASLQEARNEAAALHVALRQDASRTVSLVHGMEERIGKEEVGVGEAWKGMGAAREEAARGRWEETEAMLAQHKALEEAWRQADVTSESQWNASRSAISVRHEGAAMSLSSRLEGMARGIQAATVSTVSEHITPLTTSMLPTLATSQRERLSAVGTSLVAQQTALTAAGGAATRQTESLTNTLHKALCEQYVRDLPTGLTPRRLEEVEMEVMDREEVEAWGVRTRHEDLLAEDYPTWLAEGEEEEEEEQEEEEKKEREERDASQARERVEALRLTEEERAALKAAEAAMNQALSSLPALESFQSREASGLGGIGLGGGQAEALPVGPSASCSLESDSEEDKKVAALVAGAGREEEEGGGVGDENAWRMATTPRAPIPPIASPPPSRGPTPSKTPRASPLPGRYAAVGGVLGERVMNGGGGGYAAQLAARPKTPRTAGTKLRRPQVHATPGRALVETSMMEDEDMME